MFYDPMIAKLVTWAPTRTQAIDAQVDALDQFVIDGISDNVDFLSALMQHPRFRSGEITTGFIAEEYPEGFHGAPADAQLLADLTVIAGHGRGDQRRARGRDQRPARPAAAPAVRAHCADRGRRAQGADQALHRRYARDPRWRRADRHRRPVDARAAAADRGHRRPQAHRASTPCRPRLGATDARRHAPCRCCRRTSPSCRST